MKNLRKLKFSTPLSSSILMEKGGNYIFESIEGLTESEVDLHTINFSNYAGGKYKGHKLQAREIVVEGYIMGNRASREVLRRDIIRVLNPESGLGTLEILMWDGLAYYIDAICTNLTINDKEVVHNIKPFQATFVCPSPYFKGQLNELNFTEKDKLFTFPFNLDLEDPTDQKFGQYNESNQKDIFNSGDVPSPFVARVVGSSVAPVRLQNLTTGEFIQLDTDIKSDEIIEISTQHNNKYCVKIKATGVVENCFELMSFDSTFFSLARGRNRLVFTSGDIEATRNLISLEYTDLYNGI